MNRIHASTPRLLARHAIVRIGSSVLIATLFAVVALVLALAPRGFAVLATAEMRHQLRELSDILADLGAEGAPGAGALVVGAPTAGGVFAPLDAAVGRLGDQPEPLASIAGTPTWFLTMPARSIAATAVTPQPQPAELALVIEPGWESRVEFTSGAAPAAWKGDDLDGSLPMTRPVIEVALSEDAAHEMKVGVGDVLGYDPAAIEVSGVYRPLDPGDGYWEHAYYLGTSYVSETPNGPDVVYASAYLAPESVTGLAGTLRFAEVTAWLPLDAGRVDVANATSIAEQVEQASGAGLRLPGATLPLRSDLGAAIIDSGARIDVLAALLGLAASGAFGVVIAVFALGVRSVIERRAPALALAAARGASGLQLRGLMAGEGIMLALPGTLAALAAAALLLPVPVGPEAVLLPVLAGASVPVLFALLTSPRNLRSGRGDVSLRSRSRVRWIAELAMLGLAALSVSLLAARGLADSSRSVGLDPLLVAAPLLLTGAASVIALRLYPLPLLALQKALRSRRGAVGVLGAARAAREPVLGFIAALALLGGVAVAVFSAGMGTTVTAGLATAARESVGADIRVEAPMLGEDVLAEVTALPGVTAATGLVVLPRQDLAIDGDRTDVTLILADAEAMRIIRPDLPAGLGDDGDGIPVVLSDDLAASIGTGEDAAIGDTPVAILGTARVSGFPGVEESWVLVDGSHLDDLGVRDQTPRTMLVDVAPGAGIAETAEAAVAIVLEAAGTDRADNVTALDAESELSVIRGSPLVGGFETALRLALLVATALAIVTIVLASLAAASRRASVVGILRTLGITGRQTTALVAWEIAPVALTAAIAGTAAGLALVGVVTAAVDLRPFLGGDDAPGPVVDPFMVAAVVAAFLAVAAIATLVATLISRRRHPAQTLTMGAE